MQNKGIIFNDYRKIGDVLAQNDIKKPFVCCGKSFQKTKIFEYLKQFDIVVFDNIRPNPRFEDMVDGAKVFNDNHCDFLIGAGGGSPIDSAKMIRLITTNDIATCLSEPMNNNDIKSLYIPTTAGTGAETTKSSVFYINEKDKKSIANLDFLPDYILLDSSLLETLPDYQRKVTCLDALCHSIESYWSVKATDESREYARKGILGFVENKDGYISNTKKGNESMLWASYYAGRAINITGTTCAHAMCYNITMNCNTAHGHSVASGLSVIWEYMIEHHNELNGNLTEEELIKTFDEIGVMLGGKNAQDGLRIFLQILKDFDLPYPKTDLSNIPLFVSKVDVTRLSNNPVKFTSDDLTNIYTEIFKR